MKSAGFSSLALLLVVAVMPALGQRPGGNMGGQRRMGGQRQMGPQSGQMQQQRVRATQQQQKQYTVCSEAMKRVRSRIRQMTRLAAAEGLDAQQMQALGEQLEAEWEAAQQEQAQLAESLSQEQKDAAQDQLQSMAKSTEELDSFAEALGFELGQAALDEGKVREQIKNLDAAAAELQQEQKKLGAELEMD